MEGVCVVGGGGLIGAMCSGRGVNATLCRDGDGL